jgi:hypothetical protein
MTSIQDIVNWAIRSKRKLAEEEQVSGLIESATKSQSGKSVSVKIGNVYYTCKDFNVLNWAGQVVSFATSQSEWQGNTMHWMNDPVLVDNAHSGGGNNIPAPVPPVSQSQASQATPIANSIAPMMPFISNTVAHAIANGLIKTPTDVGTWAENCVEAIVNSENKLNPF